MGHVGHGHAAEPPRFCPHRETLSSLAALSTDSDSSDSENSDSDSSEGR